MERAAWLTNFVTFEAVPTDLRKSQRDPSLFPVLLEHPYGEMEHRALLKELRENTIVLDCFEIGCSMSDRSIVL